MNKRCADCEKVLKPSETYTLRLDSSFGSIDIPHCKECAEKLKNEREKHEFPMSSNEYDDSRWGGELT